MIVRLLLIVWMVAAVAGPAWPCSVGGPLPSAEALVRDAEVVARVRAEGLSSTRGRPGGITGSSTQVRFTVLDVLKGRLPSTTIEFNGSLTDRDDHNRGPVPYDLIRPGGSAGCFALQYRLGAEYLLLLQRGKHPSYAQPNDLTPYWSALGPTNEQLFGGASDAWFVWVSGQLARRPGA